MRFVFTESMCDPGEYRALAIAADDSGFASFAVPDSLCYPEVSDTRYPYTPDGSREFLLDQPFIEPFSLIPALGAVTEKLRFLTFVVKLPVRPPVLVAKQASSVAVLTNNRFALGVGLSPWPEDYRACDEPWERRGERMDEMIEIIRGLLAGHFYAFRGEFYELESVKICPVPSEPLPILVGGHADPALRRAARLGDGWMHAGSDGAQLRALLARLAELRRECGRERDPFEIHVVSEEAYTPDGVRRLEDLGVTDAIVGVRDAYRSQAMPLERKLDALRRYADEVIAKL